MDISRFDNKVKTLLFQIITEGFNKLRLNELLENYMHVIMKNYELIWHIDLICVLIFFLTLNIVYKNK